MDEFGFRNREGETPGCRNSAQGVEVALKELNIAPVCSGGNCDHKIIHIGDYYAFGNYRVQWGDVDNEEAGRDGGALGGANRNWGERSWGPLEEEPTHAV